LKHHVLDLVQVAILTIEKAENVFAGPGVLFNHRFLALAEVAFWAGQTTENEFA
jgi:hypothetical protein